jgi:tryptophan 2,3-dioxygenase
MTAGLVKFSEAMSSMWLCWRANSAEMAEKISGSRDGSGVALSIIGGERGVKRKG